MFSSWYEDAHLDVIVKFFFFFTFFHIVNLVIFHPQYIDSGYLVSTTPHTILILIFLQLCTCVFSIVWRCACAFHIILAIFFITFFHFLNLFIFWAQMYRQWVPCDCNFPYNFKPAFLKLCTFSPMSAEVHVVWIWFLNLFLSLFPR